MNEANKMRMFFVIMALSYIFLYTWPSCSSNNSSNSSSSVVYVYKDVDASGFVDLYWIISAGNDGMKFKYIAKDGKGEKTLKSGKCMELTFEDLKKYVPNAVIRGAVQMQTKIWLLGPIEEHYSGRDVYGILVPSTARLYMNDGAISKDEFIELCKLELQKSS